MRFEATGLILVLLLLSVGAVIGCGGSSGSTGSDSDAGGPADAFADLVDDDRETVVISVADQAEDSFIITPASFDTVIVRAVEAGDTDARIVEALAKGSFPDGCTELHEMEQDRRGERTLVNLTMRRPEQAVCTQVVRPYRFFFRLEGRYEPGSYVLQINDDSYRFTVE